MQVLTLAKYLEEFHGGNKNAMAKSWGKDRANVGRWFKTSHQWLVVVMPNTHKLVQIRAQIVVEQTEEAPPETVTVPVDPLQIIFDNYGEDCDAVVSSRLGMGLYFTKKGGYPQGLFFRDHLKQLLGFASNFLREDHRAAFEQVEKALGETSC